MARFLSFQNHSTPEIIHFLSENVIGTPGQSMVYQQMRTVDKLKHIPTPTFMSLKKGGRIIGTSCFCKRPSPNYEAYYIRYFSFKELYRRRTTRNNRTHKKSSVKQEVMTAMDDGGELAQGTIPSLFYAYVDPKNERSNELCREFGFKKIRTFATMTFSRFSPNRDTRVSLLRQEEKHQIQPLLKGLYKNHNFYTEENLFYDDNYFVLRNENHEILAGVQASKEHWKIKEMPGYIGWITLNILTQFPFLRRVIKTEHRFLAFEYFYFKENHEKELKNLLESVLDYFSLNSGLIAIDSNSELYHCINKLSLGPLNVLKKEVSADIIVKSSNVSKLTHSELMDRPSFISTLDLT